MGVTLSEVEALAGLTGLHASASCASFSSESCDPLGSRPNAEGVALTIILTAALRGGAGAGESCSAESSGAASSQP
jgi:hypothetical protein